MFWSRNNFFSQNDFTLAKKRIHVKRVCDYKGIDATRYLESYDFFLANRDQFDGATIVKDLDDINNLDFSALRHDFEYSVELKKRKGLKWLCYKIKIDWKYGRDMEVLGKGIITPYSRAIGLIISTPIYLAILLFRKKAK
mgnify:CR=1 FL=1